MSRLPYFHCAVKEAHNVVSQVYLQHRCGAGPILPLSRVYTHWSIHTEVHSKRMWAQKNDGERRQKLRTACVSLYQTWQQKDRKVACWWETCGIEMSQVHSALTSTCWITPVQLYFLIINENNHSVFVVRLIYLIINYSYNSINYSFYI